MPIAAPSSVSSTSRTSSVVTPSARTTIQSAPPGSTLPRSFGPANVPPATRPMRRLPTGVAPIGCMPATSSVTVHRWVVRISAMRSSLRRLHRSDPIPRLAASRARPSIRPTGPCRSVPMSSAYPLPEADPSSLGFAARPLFHLEALIQQHIEEGRYPGAQIALARHGKLALVRSYGSAKTEPTKQPVTNDSLFLLFSQTKVLTSAAVWALVEEGKLSFMDRVADPLPEFAARGKSEITLHQVMTHQGGFPSNNVTKATWTDHARMRAEVCDFALDWTPGSKLQYHGQAAHLVQAMVIEAVTGQDYRDVIRDKVIAPLGLGGDVMVGVPKEHQSRCTDRKS